MYINKEYVEKKGLEPHDIFYFGLIFQNVSENMLETLLSYISDVDYRLYEELGLVKFIKAKNKSQHILETIRLTPKGKEVYRNAQIPNFTVEDEALLEHLTVTYNGVEKSIGNEAKVKDLLAWFCVTTGYSRRMVYKAIKFYIGTLVDNKEEKYIATLENLIWKPNNVFSTKKSVSDSKLYQFIQVNKEELNGNTTN